MDLDWCGIDRFGIRTKFCKVWRIFSIWFGFWDGNILIKLKKNIWGFKVVNQNWYGVDENGVTKND